MPRPLRRLAAALAVVGLLLAPASTALASSKTMVEAETAPPIFDALIMRPFGLAGLGASAALWVPTQLITMAVRPSEWRTPIEHMLVKPYRFVFVDPLGSH
jgi:hypothetical protein